jgi:hypothetical protein
MSCKLFYTDYEISKAEYQTNKRRLGSFQYNDRDDALRRARQIGEHGGIAWESSDGTTLNRYQMPKCCGGGPAILGARRRYTKTTGTEGRRPKRLAASAAHRIA